MTQNTKPPLVPYAGFQKSGRGYCGINDATLIELWRKGLDTHQIARRVNRTEAEVYNRLAQVGVPTAALADDQT